MSIRDILPLQTKQQEWSRLKCNSVDTLSANIDGDCTIKGVNFSTPTTGSPGDILKRTTLNTTGWAYDGSFAIGFGAEIAIAPGYAVLNGLAKTESTTLADEYSSYYVNHPSTLRSISISTRIGSTGSLLNIYKNNLIVLNNYLASNIQVMDGLNISFNKGDKVNVQISGFPTGGATFVLFFQ